MRASQKIDLIKNAMTNGIFYKRTNYRLLLCVKI